MINMQNYSAESVNGEPYIILADSLEDAISQAKAHNAKAAKSWAVKHHSSPPPDCLVSVRRQPHAGVLWIGRQSETTRRDSLYGYDTVKVDPPETTARDEALIELREQADDQEGDLVRRAGARYALDALDGGGDVDENGWPYGLPIPGNTSYGADHDGRLYAVLINVNGTLAVYLLEEDGSLTALETWPEEVAEER
jgi:hypothetical protein